MPSHRLRLRQGTLQAAALAAPEEIEEARLHIIHTFPPGAHCCGCLRAPLPGISDRRLPAARSADVHQPASLPACCSPGHPALQCLRPAAPAPHDCLTTAQHWPPTGTYFTTTPRAQNEKPAPRVQVAAAPAEPAQLDKASLQPAVEATEKVRAACTAGALALWCRYACPSVSGWTLDQAKRCQRGAPDLHAAARLLSHAVGRRARVVCHTFVQAEAVQLGRSCAALLSGLARVQAAGQLQAVVEDLHDANSALSDVTAAEAPPAAAPP